MVDNVSKPFTFTANTYAKANEVNADFDALYTGLNSTINQVNTNTNSITTIGSSKADKVGDSTQTFNVANPVTDANAVNLATLKAMYPVGSIYIGTTEDCPIASLFGTWTKVAANRVLQGSSSSHEAGTTISAGLPDVTGQNDGFSILGRISTGNTGAISLGRGTHNNFDSDSAGSTYGSKLIFKASDSSSIYGNSTTVQPPAYVVNIWRRTA